MFTYIYKQKHIHNRWKDLVGLNRNFKVKYKWEKFRELGVWCVRRISHALCWTFCFRLVILRTSSEPGLLLFPAPEIVDDGLCLPDVTKSSGRSRGDCGPPESASEVGVEVHQACKTPRQGNKSPCQFKWEDGDKKKNEPNEGEEKQAQPEHTTCIFSRAFVLHFAPGEWSSIATAFRLKHANVGFKSLFLGHLKWFQRHV